jgi:F0F1-type ATP synthase assembly protein I
LVPRCLYVTGYKFHCTDPLHQSVSRQLYTAVIMKTVILVFLLVAAALVHSASLESGKLLYQYCKHPAVYLILSDARTSVTGF